MKNLINNYKDCDVFSLSYFPKDVVKITDEDFLNAISLTKKENRELLRNIYNDLNISIPFDELYKDIEDECYYFYKNEDRNKYISDDYISNLKSVGRTDLEIDDILKDFFRCHFIYDLVGISTKYGSDNYSFYSRMYSSIAFIIDLEKSKCKIIGDGVSPLDVLPIELRNNLILYNYSFNNEVNTCSDIMINYYFKNNSDSVKYLLNYEDEFSLDEFQDLAFYKNGTCVYSSCTHEMFSED